MDQSPKLRVKIDEYAKIRMTLNFSLVYLPDLKLTGVAFRAQYVDRLFPGAAFAKLSFTCDLFTADSAGDEFTSPSAGFAGFGQGDLANTFAGDASHTPPYQFPEVFFGEPVKAYGFGFPCTLTVRAFLFAKDYCSCAFAGCTFSSHRF